MVVEGEKQFTASVWILTKTSPKKVLLVHHKKSGKWQQPGGHIEKGEDPVEAAIRETREETGLDIGFLRNEIKYIDEESNFLPVPRFFMEQTIFPHKNEPKHIHLDLNYVVEVDEQDVLHNEREAYDIRWFTRDEVDALETHGDTKVVIEELMPS